MTRRSHSPNPRHRRWMKYVALLLTAAAISVALVTLLFQRSEDRRVRFDPSRRAYAVALPPPASAAGPIAVPPKDIYVVARETPVVIDNPEPRPRPAPKIDPPHQVPTTTESVSPPGRSRATGPSTPERVSPPTEPVSVPAPPPALVAVAPGHKPGPGGRAAKGSRPALRIGTDLIGFARYGEAMGRLQARFYAMDRADAALGPEVDLRSGKIVPRRDPVHLDLERVFVVTDPAVEKLLRGAALDESYRLDAVTMALPGWSSALLWRQIEAALRERDLNIDTVALIEGDYLAEGTRVMLALHAAILRDSGRRVPLKTLLELLSR